MSNSPLSLISTRAPDLSERRVGVSLLRAVENGLAEDGGLYIPKKTPRIDWAAVSDSSFQSCSVSFLDQWLGGALPTKKVIELVEQALNFEVPLRSLPPTSVKGHEGVGSFEGQTHILELFHGPTLSFKDFGARAVAFLLGERIKETRKSVTILVATSGDTGSAVADGLSGMEGVRVVLLFPASQISWVQEQQLIVKRPGVLPLRVKGNFDDCQRLVKGAFEVQRLQDLNLSTANSINIGRLIPQMLYYVWAVKKLGTPDISFVVPSGNLGNLTAGVMAHLSGMPVSQFVAAHNSNDFFSRFLSNPQASQTASIRTLSNAMDVGSPSNYERLSALLSPVEMRRLITGMSFSDDQMLETMSEVYSETGYVADPHTSIGLAAANKLRGDGRSTSSIVVLSTAHPAKFPETVGLATKSTVEKPVQLEELERRPRFSIDLDLSESALTEAILSHEWNR